MAKFKVDVKAFIALEVEAESEGDARAYADEYVEQSLSPGEMEAEAWNDVQKAEGWKSTRITYAGSFVVDGTSEVEEED